MLFVGDDWAEDHHDVEVQDESGRRLAKARLPEGVAGMARLHALLAVSIGEPTLTTGAEQVVVGIETDRGPWVQALVAAGYRVFAVNPLQVAAVPGTAQRLGCEERRRGCAHAGRHGPHRRPPAAPGRRGQRAGRGGSRSSPARTRR